MIIGEKIDRLTIVKFLATDKWETYYLCVCDCGSTKVRTYKYLHKQTTQIEKSCGCARSAWLSSTNKKNAKRSGLSHREEYAILSSIKQRCYNLNHVHFDDYGGRGITVCDRWLGDKGIENFISDMGNRPSKLHTVDREDVNGNYEPSNCKWATHREQSLNRRNTVRYEVRGEPLTVTEIADKYGVNRNTLYSYLKRKGIDETINRFIK